MCWHQIGHILNLRATTTESREAEECIDGEDAERWARPLPSLPDSTLGVHILRVPPWQITPCHEQ